MAEIRCLNCRSPYPDAGAPYKCPVCGGLFDFTGAPQFEPDKVDPSRPGIWRYRHALQLPEYAPEVSLGEGNTPLIRAEAFGKQIAFKLEFTNPSGSFKDRGMAVVLSFLCSRGIEAAVEDSSGNAGASFAAYAARAGVKGQVFIPDSASGPKRKQIEAYGAEVVRIMGPRSNAAEAARTEVEKGAVYASHAYLPFVLPGYATAAYEIWEQLGGLPGSVVVPAGQGGLALGLSRGFEALLASNQIERTPKLYAVQARACAPLWALSKYGADGLNWVAEAPTLAEGVRVKHPLRGDAVLRAVESSGGEFLAVDEEDILTGRDELAKKGFYVEPTSAIVWQALAQVRDRLEEPVVVMLTGSGMKAQ